jgi:glutathione S-transferase
MGNCSSKAPVVAASPPVAVDVEKKDETADFSPDDTLPLEADEEEKDDQVSTEEKIDEAIVFPLETAESKDYDLILWDRQPAANSTVIRAFLALSDGITFKERDVSSDPDIPEHASKLVSYLSPALECHGKCIFECTAILKFLCRTFPSKYGKYYPEDDIEKVTTIDWLCDYMNTGILAQLPKAVFPTLGLQSNPGDVSAMAMTKPFTRQSQEEACDYILEALKSKYIGIFLENTTYLLSNQPTIADFRFAPMINFIKVGCVIPQRLQKYYDDMTKLHGFKKACQPTVKFTSPHWKRL